MLRSRWYVVLFAVVLAVAATTMPAAARTSADGEGRWITLTPAEIQTVQQAMVSAMTDDKCDKCKVTGQQTTTGLIVWRKADNWTAFTNGSRTWINGPAGVQDRANDEGFPWEAQ